MTRPIVQSVSLRELPGIERPAERFASVERCLRDASWSASQGAQSGAAVSYLSGQSESNRLGNRGLSVLISMRLDFAGYVREFRARPSQPGCPQALCFLVTRRRFSLEDAANAGLRLRGLCVRGEFLGFEEVLFGCDHDLSHGCLSAISIRSAACSGPWGSSDRNRSIP